MEWLMLKLKLQSGLIGKDPDAGSLRAGEEWGNRGGDGWMASSTQWTWVSANSGRQRNDREGWCTVVCRKNSALVHVCPMSYMGHIYMGFPGGSDSKEYPCNAGDLGLIAALGRSPLEGNGNPLQYSCLENPTDRGAWWATAHGVAESDMTEWLIFSHFSYIYTTKNIHFLKLKCSWKSCILPGNSCGLQAS